MIHPLRQLHGPLAARQIVRPSRGPRLVALFAALLLAASPACRAPSTESAAAALRSPALRSVPLRESAIDVEHYALDLDLDPAARTLEGTCRIRLHAREALARIELDLVGLEVRAVRDERGRELAFTHQGGVVSIERPLARGEMSEIAVLYGGTPGKGLWFVAERDGVATQVFTQGECEDARWWFPCFDHPSDRATSELRVTMPAAWKAVAAGERIERQEHGARATELWACTFPHPTYLLTLVAGELAVHEDACEGTPLSYLADPRFAEWLPESFAETCEILTVFEELTGRRYPYPKYSQACVANFPFGGMENISASTLTETTLGDERGRRDSPSTGLVAHEAAHQWFGDFLTCLDWPHIWLNEGFATYFGALYTERVSGADEFRLQMRDAQDAYVARDVGANRRPMIDDRYRDPFDLFFSGHAYQGGAVRLHLLRFALGEEAFFRGVRLYVGRNAGRGVVTDDLRAALEEASQKKLSPFFEQWFESPGYPEFSVEWRHDPKREQIIVGVAQVQSIGDGTPSVFELPVEVAIRDSKGVRVERAKLDARRQLLTFAATEEPISVRFDPHGWIPKKLDERKKPSEWFAILAGDPVAAGRREAAQVAGKFLVEATNEEDRQKVADALLAALEGDASGAVRAAAASALARASLAPRVRSALMRAGSSDALARVRVAALEALKPAAGDPSLVAYALQEYQAGFSWNTMGAAAGLRRAASPADAFAWLEGELARASSPHGRLETRLIGELATLEDRRVPPLLARIAADPREGEGRRVAAVNALAARGKGDATVVRMLVGLLGTDLWRLRRETIATLGLLADPIGLRALEAYYPTSLFSTERRAIEASLEAQAKRES